MKTFVREARFEDFEGHRSPVLRWRPRASVRAQAVFFPPFGDEMNQSRRMFRLTAEALAERGVASCVFDLLGTGDSSADFGEATMSAWLRDCRTALERSIDAYRVPMILIGCRLGAALAIIASESLTTPAHGFIAWAPLLQGRQQLGGWLRAARFTSANRPGTQDPSALWAAGETAWLAGYPVSPLLAQELLETDASGLPRARRAMLLDVRNVDEASVIAPSEVLTRRATNWTAHGLPTEALAVKGPFFWNVADLVDVPQLIKHTVSAVDEALDGSSDACAPANAAATNARA